MKKQTTFNKTMVAFPTYLHREGNADSTIQAYMTDLRQFDAFLKGPLKNKIRYVEAISKVEIRQFKDYLLELKLEGKLKRSTIDRKFNSLKTWFAFIESEFDIVNIVKNDPFGNKKRSTEKGRDFLPKVLEKHDIQLILDTIRKSTDKNKFRDYAIFQLLIGLGCRRSEILALKWSDLHFRSKDSTITITREKTKNQDVLPMDDDSKRALLVYADTLPKMDTYVFHTRESLSMSPTAFTNAIRHRIAASGISTRVGFPVTSSTFRHTFITALVRNDYPAEVIMRFTGHKSAECINHYLHLKTLDLLKPSEDLRRALTA